MADARLPCSAVVAFLYPGYASFKCLSQRPASEAELERWLTYWSVLGCIVFVEYVAEWLVSWSVLAFPSSYRIDLMIGAGLQDTFLLPHQNAIPPLPCTSSDPRKYHNLPHLCRALLLPARTPDRRCPRRTQSLHPQLPTIASPPPMGQCVILSQRCTTTSECTTAANYERSGVRPYDDAGWTMEDVRTCDCRRWYGVVEPAEGEYECGDCDAAWWTE